MADRPNDTRDDAYKKILADGTDVTVRKKVAAAVAREPSTVDELASFLPHKENAIRPRVDELIRMDCVRREGKRTNPSGHEAYVHHITTTGEAYLRGEIDPEPDPPLVAIKRNVVDAARDYLNGEVDEYTLRAVVAHHDSIKKQKDPEWDGEIYDR